MASELVTVSPKKGTFVAKMWIEQLIEMFEVMAELEGMCGRLAARRITASELEALRTALERCEAAADKGEADEYYYENEDFHQCIYTASHNSFLAAEANQLKQRLKPYRRLQLKVRHRIRNSLEEHREIFAAIETGEADHAEKTMRKHVLIQGERFSDFASSMKEFHNRATQIADGVSG